MAPGANVPTKSGTGTVPKTKRNNPVPREMVAPTRRDMQTQNGSGANYEWRIESENPGGSNGSVNNPNFPNLFDIYCETDLLLDSNRFVPVRPQPRSLGLSQHEDDGSQTYSFRSISPQNMAANTAIVMPTTPGAPRTRENTPYCREQRSCVVFNANTPNGGSIAQIESANASSQLPPITTSNAKTNNITSRPVPDRQFLEQKIQQIRDYIKITSTMMQHAVSDENQMVSEEDVDMIRLTTELKDSESKLLKQLWELDNNDEVQNDSNFVRNEFQEPDRATSSMSQTSQSSYNTINNRMHQQTRQTTPPTENDQLRNSQKNKRNISNRSSRASSHTNTRDDARSLQTYNEHAGNGATQSHDQSDKQIVLKDLQMLLESVANSVNPNERSCSREVTPINNEVFSVQEMEATVGELTERLRTLRSAGSEQSSIDVFGQMENIKRLHERIAKLKKQSDEREELTRILGERDEQLSVEHRALQDKIRDLHKKKDQVEKLAMDLQSMALPPQRDESLLGAMRSQLAQFQTMLDNVTRTEADLNTNNVTQIQQEPLQSTSNCNINKYENTNARNRNVYHPIDFPIENRDSLDEEEDAARGGGRFDKKINKNVPIVGRFEQEQMILKAELQAKKRELEELMRKDQDRTSTNNQSDISRFAQEDNFHGLSSVDNQTDNEYSSEEDEPGHSETVRFNGSARNIPNHNNHLNNQLSSNHSNNVHLLNVIKMPQPVSSNISNHEGVTDMSACSTPEPTTIWCNTSQTSGRHMNNTKKPQEQIQSNASNHDNASMSICSGMESMPPAMIPLWRKTSQEGVTNLQKQSSSWSGPWSYVNSDTQRQDGSNTVNSDTIPNPSVANSRQQPPQGSREWWQKKALQLQQQLELTSNLCQSILVDQQTSSQSPASSVQNEPPYTSFATMPLNAAMVVPPTRPPIIGQGTPVYGNPAEIHSQNMIAASQLHFQSMLITSLNHCQQLLWMQQRELSSLKNAVTYLQDRSLSQRESVSTNTCPSASQIPPFQSQNNQKSFPNTPIIPPNNDLLYQSSYTYPTQNNITQSGQNYLQPQQNIHNASTCQHTFSTNTSSAQNPPCVNPHFNNQTSMPAAVANNSMPIPPFQAERLQCQQNIPAQVNWTGVQALNNQVPPGNRANNYWDNFRSYSRQNLLSTTSKSNEGSSHSPSPLIDRSHNMFRTNGCPGPVDSFQLNQASLPKLNTNNTMQEDNSKLLPQKKSQQVRHSDISINVNQNNDLHLNNQNVQNLVDLNLPSSSSAAQSHLLNIFQQNLNAGMDAATGVVTGASGQLHPPSNLQQRNSDLDSSNIRPVFDIVQPTCSNSSSKKCSKSCPERNIYDPNEYRESSRNDSNDEQPKTKLFDMLRDNVYKEVTNLISANENRPHFLIQLFRDLQLISSDGLRRRTLQSIQGVVTDSFANFPNNGRGASRQNAIPQNIPIAKQENSQLPENEISNSNYKSENSHLPILDRESEINGENSPSNLDNRMLGVFCNLVPFLEVNLENVCSDLICEVIRMLALQLVPTLPCFASNHERIKYYFEYSEPQLSANLETVINKFKGCRMHDVSDEILSSITEVVLAELTYCFGDESGGQSNDSTEQSQSYEQSVESHGNSENRVEQDVNQQESINCPQIFLVNNNGDLAEADQSHENEEEEGAVGGIAPDDALNPAEASLQSEDVSSEDTAGNTEADTEWITFEPLLDCVPSRLTDNNDAPEESPTNPTDKPPGSTRSHD